MFWSLVKRIDQGKISAEDARILYEEMLENLDEEQQELVERKIEELEDEEHYWEITKKITSKEFYEDDSDSAIEDQLQEYDNYPFDDEPDEE